MKNKLGKVKITSGHTNTNHWSNKYIGQTVNAINGNSELLCQVGNRYCGKFDNFNMEIIEYPTNIPKNLRKEINLTSKLDNSAISERAKKIFMKKYHKVFDNVNII